MDFKNKITEAQMLSAPQLNLSGLSQDIGRSLIVAPHPDDEALGCGGIIALLRQQNTEVHVVFVTNGGASHPNSVAYDTNKLQALRKEEALKSCKVLGVQPEKVHFISFEDSKLHLLNKENQTYFNNRLDSIFKICEFDSLFTTWRKDAHSDHRATYNLCKTYVDQLNRPIQMIEYPIWLWKNGKSEDWPSFDEVEPFRLNVESVRMIKETAIHQHVSQTTRLINDDPEGFILTEELLEPFSGNFEFFLFTLDKDKSTLNQEYFKRLYSDSEDPWNFRTSEYERKKYLKTLEYLKYYRFKNALEIGCSIGEHSKLLSRHCDKLTAIDISSDAIKTAKDKYEDEQIDFQVWNVSEGLPKASYDLITMCEVGYYLEKKDLIDLFIQTNHQLKMNGRLLLVHWTSYVRDYPLSGKQVHRIFDELDFPGAYYKKEVIYSHTNYELILLHKNPI